MRENILKVWGRADTIDFTEGMVAYRRLRTTLEWFAGHYECPLPGVVAAFAALSPNSDYLGNLRSLLTLLEGRARGLPVEQLTVSTYLACRSRAWAFLQGVDFLATTKGPKTRNFYQNILNPDDPQPVTIDGHMVCVSIGERMTMREAVRSRFRYGVVADAFRAAAAELAILPNQLQAVCWFTWKRMHNVIYDPQLDSFRPGDHWKYLVRPEHLKPYHIGVRHVSIHATRIKEHTQRTDSLRAVRAEHGDLF